LKTEREERSQLREDCEAKRWRWCGIFSQQREKKKEEKKKKRGGLTIHMAGASFFQ